MSSNFISSSSPSWCLIESDPAVFSELLVKIGVKNVQCEEIYSLDNVSFDEFLKSNKNIYGFIFLFKWKMFLEKIDDRKIDKEAENFGLFFAKQMIENGCATQAMLSILLNQIDKIEIGEELTTLKEFCIHLDPQMKGLAISNSDMLREAHNSFKQKSAFEYVKEDDFDVEDKDAQSFHFISYVPFMNKVYELDGLKKGPICIGDFDDNMKWEYLVKDEIQKRVERTGGGEHEVLYNLLAFVEDKLHDIQNRILIEKYVIQRANSKLISLGESIMDYETLDESKAPAEAIAIDMLPNSISELQSLVLKAHLSIERLKEQEEEEIKKRNRGRKENVRRCHDFIPFILAALREMCRRNQLTDAFAACVAEQSKKENTSKK